MKKDRIRIGTVDIIGGRVIVEAPDVVDGTQVDVHLNASREVWGSGKVAAGQAFVIGQPLAEQHSLTLTVHPLNPKLLTA
ncbi:hypothetical protein [Spirosoma oryzicola]|uniref:hypothetical protein n=1 Tax=Spirosoma oryzicola TaxID=2898794 RepID=UPI001E51B0CC|nr:hypothetical protein [Spirosoma oryzicola]UHG91764.1 hypothetical protein LQ777_02430 [Spirosoma oryzicola]